MRKLTLILAVLLCVASILTAQETKGKPTIVVIPFDAKNIEQTEVEVLLDTFTNKIADSGKFKVVDRSKVDEIKKQHEFQNSDWSSDEKVAKLGNALNANMVVVGKLMPFQKKINASFRILDVNTMEIVSTADGVFDDILVFFNKIPEIVKKLTGETKSVSTTSNITTSKPKSSSVSTNVSTPKTKSTSSTSSISIPITSNFSTSSTSKTTTTYGKTYNIGDTGPGGGIIFYYSQYGFDVYEPDGSVKKCHYLEVSKFDLGAISWCSKKDGADDCCNITTNEDLGYGRINTFKIIKSSHKGGTITKENCAALACHSYSTATTKAGDWFLPNEEELILLKQNLGTRIWASNPINDNYVIMTSHQANDRHVWLIDFTHNSYFKHNKCNSYFVRAIRAF